MQETMRAVGIHGFGGAEVLADMSWPKPELRPGDVRVRLEAVSLNLMDVLFRTGRMSKTLPQVLGRDFAGVVDAVGEGVDGLAIGDPIWGYHASIGSNGAYAEYMCIPAELVGLRPRSLSVEESAAMPVAGLTAYRCVEKTRRRKLGSALVTGAAGGVGAMLTQILLLDGVETVIATAGSDRSRDYLLGLGLKPQNILRYEGLSPEQLVEAVRERNGGRLVDAAFDCVGGAMKRLCFDAAAIDADVVSIVEEPADFPVNIWDEHTSPLMHRSLSYHFAEIGVRARSGPRDLWPLYRQELDWLAQRIDQGLLKTPTVTVLGAMSAEVARRGHELMEGGHPGGKLVMTI